MSPSSEADQENSDHDELERLRRYRERLQSLEKLRNDANLEVEDRKLELKEAKEHAKICERNLQRAVRGDDGGQFRLRTQASQRSFAVSFEFWAQRNSTPEDEGEEDAEDDAGEDEGNEE